MIAAGIARLTTLLPPCRHPPLPRPPRSHRYTVHSLIGKGSYGLVCAAKDNLTGEMVAIKKIQVCGHVNVCVCVCARVAIPASSLQRVVGSFLGACTHAM